MLSCVKTFCSYSVLIIVLIGVLPGLPPYGIDFAEKEFVKLPLKGDFKPNSRLEDGFEDLSVKVNDASFGILKGPEAFEERDGYLYTGIVGGEVVRLDLKQPKDGVWETVFRKGKVCTERYDEPECGRPLAMKFDKEGRLVVADVFFGIYRIASDFKSSETIVPPNNLVNGRINTMINGLSLAKDGSIYYTVSYTNFDVRAGILGMTIASNGRLCKYDAKTRTSEVLLEKLNTANGVMLSPDEDYVLVGSLGAGEITKVHLKGKRAGESEVLLRVPGMPDNISSNGKGGYLIAIAHIPHDVFNPAFDFLYKYPLFCRFMLRLLYPVWYIPGWLDANVYSSPALRQWQHSVFNLEAAVAMDPLAGLIVEFDGQGNVMQTWQSPTRAVNVTSEAYLYDGYLYIGSFMNARFGRVAYK